MIGRGTWKVVSLLGTGASWGDHCRHRRLIGKNLKEDYKFQSDMVAINKLDLWPPCTPRGGRRQQENLEKTGNGGNDYAMPREQDEADALPTRSRNVDVYPTLRHRAKHSTRLR